MAGWSFTGIDEIDELFDSVAFNVWNVIAIVAGVFILLWSNLNPAQYQTYIFYYFTVILGLVWLSTIDRDESTEGGKALAWAVICFTGLLLISFFSNLLVGIFGLQQLSLVPKNYLGLSVFGVASASVLSTLGTIYLVGTGEENLKGLATYLFNIFEPVETLLGIDLPDMDASLAVQPLIWLIVAAWAIGHTIIGQNPIWYSIPVFFDGLWIMHCNSKEQGGTWLTGTFGHIGNNLFFTSLVLLGFIH